MRYAIGMDIGGNSARVALVAGDGHILHSALAPTRFDTPREVLLSSFARLWTEAMEQAGGLGAQPGGVGIGMPGLQDEQGRVDSASNLPQLNGTDLRGEASRVTGLPAAMENDMNVVALGEYHFGGHAVPGNLLAVAIGTGVGAALVQGGRIARVARGCLGDPGHVLVERIGRLCRCGARGCLEAYASGWAVVEQAREAGFDSGEGGPAAVFAAARQGHRAAATAVAAAVRMLGMGLASFGALYQPERVVLGGNVLVEGQDLLLQPALAEYRRMVQPWLVDVPMALSTIPQTAGILGAAALCFDH